MKKLKIPIFILISLLIFFEFSAGIEYQGEVKLSNIFLDEAGNSTFFQERYNLNKGLVLSKLSLTTLFKTNSSFHFDLSNLNADTRNLFLDLKIPQTFSWEVTHIRSRNIFDESGDIHSFRTNTSTAFSFTPFAFLKLKVSYFNHKKTGERLSYPQNTHSFLGTKYDQLLQGGELGLQLKCGKRFLDISQGMRDFKSELNDTLNRRTTISKVSVNSPIGEKTHFSGQYILNQTKAKESDQKLTSNFIGIGFSVKPQEKLLLFLKGSIWEMDEADDILKTSINLNYQVSKSYELQGGYELERRGNSFEKTTIHSILIGAQADFDNDLSMKAKYQGSFSEHGLGSMRTLIYDPTSTLLGEYSINRILFEAKYKPKEKMTFILKYLDNSRKNTDINTKAQSRTAVGGFVISCTECKGSLEGEYSFSDSRYDNYLGTYHTNNHSITSRLNCSRFEKLNLFMGYNFLSMKKDLNIEKHNFFAGGSYEFYKQFSLEGSYYRFQYDDLKIVNNYYEANVFQISLGKKF
jgi:hypothetical protein